MFVHLSYRLVLIDIFTITLSVHLRHSFYHELSLIREILIPLFAYSLSLSLAHQLDITKTLLQGTLNRKLTIQFFILVFNDSAPTNRNFFYASVVICLHVSYK